MDERTHFFLYLLLACGSFTLLGAAFGAITGFVTWRDERAAGTVVGLAVARAFARLSDDPPSRTTQGTLVGAVDGALFGLFVGIVIGLATSWQGRGNWWLLGRIVVVSAGIVVLALLLGGLAHVLKGGGRRSILGLFAGGMLGPGLGLWLGAIDGLFVGTLLGAATGAIATRLRG